MTAFWFREQITAFYFNTFCSLKVRFPLPNERGLGCFSDLCSKQIVSLKLKPFEQFGFGQNSGVSDRAAELRPRCPLAGIRRSGSLAGSLGREGGELRWERREQIVHGILKTIPRRWNEEINNKAQALMLCCFLGPVQGRSV